jgi:serine/threonine protein kinase/tetratricopeptide (TPR) repeat protein
MEAGMTPSDIGPYRLLDEIGRGGMGVVYRAEHRETGERVALKTVPVPREASLAGLRLEIHALSQIQHPGVVRIVDQGIEDGLPWYAMELLTGTTLQDFSASIWSSYSSLRRSASGTGREEKGIASAPGDAPSRGEPECSPAPSSALSPARRRSHASMGPAVGDARDERGPEGLSEPIQDETQDGDGQNECPPAAGGHLSEVLDFVRRLCDPLAYLHGRGIVHRDLKPENVFIRPDGMPILIDFGLISRSHDSIGRETLEVPEALIGTAAYIAPEQILGQRVDPRSDLYALGCMLYELVTGQLPFLGKTLHETLELHLWANARPPSQLVTDLPAELEQLLFGLLAKRPRERIGHADDVAVVLEQLGARSPSPGPASPDAQPYLYRPELVGRETTLLQLRRRLKQLRQQGGLVLLVGESGIGKTYLASEVARMAVSEGMQVVTGECQPLAGPNPAGEQPRGAPLHPFSRLLQTLADRCRQYGAEETHRLLGNGGRLLAAYEPSLAELPGQADELEPEGLAGEEARRRVLETLAAAIAALAVEQPLMVILDDLQWADEMSLGFLTSLPRSYFEQHHVLFLGTHRSDESNESLEELAARPGVERIELGRLGEPMVAALVGHMLAIAEPPRALVQTLARQTEGNPFLVAEYLRAAVGERLLFRQGGQWQVAETGEGYERLFPRSLRELVGRRLAGLTDATGQLLAAAAVLGREFEAGLLETMAGTDEETVLARLRDLFTRQIFEPVGQGYYRFVHDKLRELAYARIPEDERRRLHHVAAIAIERRYAGSERFPLYYRALAHHLKQAQVWPRAIEYLERAGEQALHDFSNREAVDLFNQALALSAYIPGVVDRARLAHWEGALVEAHLGLGQAEAGRRHADRALRHCGTPMPTSPAGWMLGLGGQVLRRVVGQVLPARPAPPFHGSPEESELLGEAAHVFNRMMEAFFLANDPIAGTYCGLRCLDLAEQLPPSAALARGYAFMTIVVGFTPLQAVARRWLERALVIADQLDSDVTRIYCLNRVSGYAIAVGRWQEARERLERAIALARELGDRRQLEEGLAIRGAGLHFEGQFAESVAVIREMAELAYDRGDPQTLCWARNIMAQSLGCLGRTHEALALLQEGRDWVDEEGGSVDRIYTYGSATMLHRQLGEWQAAEDYAARALACMEQQAPVQFFLGRSVASVATTYLALWEQAQAAAPAPGRLRQLSEGAQRACQIFRSFARALPFARPGAWTCEGTRAWLDGKTLRARWEWQAALREAERLAMPFEQAYAYFELGRHLDASERRRHLMRAGQLFEHLGALHELERTRQALSMPASRKVAAL